MTRKDIELTINNEQADQLYKDLVKWTGGEFVGQRFEGSLMDEFAFVVNNTDWKIKMSSGRPILGRKYVFVKEKYLNCWASELVLVLTDNKEKFMNFLKSRFNNDEDLDDLDYENFCYESGLDE
ncbi:MAG: hypothetical protein HOU59_gp27 (endogenous virus) [Lactobacillus phage ViSo-2018a]|uniref:Uncharacterized protein n=1 Tax=Lactobacillus phage ViSo-2018a TaxID=2267607 RepID=A0A3G6JH00_9CAUD|nr:MAG: hypothetical protein HOU59_gp27 [Lactobacillus phage ViSo-2018a]AZA17292.1 MAG: hypothetical protein DQL93_0565 [Lactobacillus phage ViSo-2018a]